MKLSIVFLLVGVLQASASLYSQNTRLNISLREKSIKDVFREIEKQSQFHFLYNDDFVDLDRVVSLDMSGSNVEEILQILFEKANVTFRVLENNLIVITPAEIAAYQQPRITGVVTDASTGEPLPGVNVIVEGTTIGVVTDIDGRYSIDVPSTDKTLVFSYIGYTSERIAIEGKNQIDIMLVADIQALEEVVVVGYGVQRRADVTGAAARLTEANMNKAVATSPVEMMQGRISGVNISQNNGEPGGGMSVRIRGSHSIRSGQEPLYVVDGVPLDNADLTPAGGSASGISGSANKNPISFLNPDDIESIDVLKDASSTAIYGARGANGVVLITTKKGKLGEGTLTYDGYVGVSALREKLPVLSAAQFRSYRTPDGAALEDRGASVDWQDEIFRNAQIQSHTITYGGGTEKHTYRASLGYQDQEGIVLTTGMEKINGKIQVTQKAFKNKLLLTGNLIASHMKDRRAPIGETGGYEGDVILTALKLNPTYPIFENDGSYFQYSTTQRNPLAMLNLTNDITLTDHILGNISGEFEILKGLKYKLNVGFDRATAERRVNQDNELTYLSNNGEANINSISANNRLIENYVTYTTSFGDNHDLTLLGGHAYQYFLVNGSELNVNGFTVDDVLYTNNLSYGNFSNARSDSNADESELQSFFGRVNYSLMDKYLFTFTFRADGSSKFGEENKYGLFPSGAFAWRLSEEDFMKSGDVFNNLKLRIGWGRTGNQEIPSRRSLLSVGTESNANGYFGGNLTSGITFIRTPNPDIQWETTTQTDIGIDFGLFGDRISGTFDYFHKETKNVLLEITASLAPTRTQWQNVENLKIVNNGIELGLNGIIVKSDRFTWDAGLNLAYIKNDVMDLPITLIETGNASGQGLSGTRVQIITNDQPIGTFYGRVFEGFDNNGLSIYKKDAQGNELLDYLGSALPDYTYSFNTKVQFGALDFSMFWYGTKGNEVYNNAANALFVKGALNTGSNVTETVFNSNESVANSNAFSSRFIEDGSFLRLSNVTLGYTLRSKAIPWLDMARFYLTGNNLLLFTDYTGFDPEVNTDAN
ncbi:MAG: TonB-dependent receptor, partial [Bacteroidales bacterium]|nr:TonB-dependent receptor [Bacteroidales bacterium]